MFPKHFLLTGVICCAKNYFSAINALLLENLIIIIKFYFLHFLAIFVAKNIL